MKKINVAVRPVHHSQYRIEGGEIFALEGIALGIAGGWWLCDSYRWHWLLGVLVGIAILTGFMWLLSMTITRLLLFSLNALGSGLLTYLLATALLRATDLTGGFAGTLVALGVGLLLFRRFDVFRHDLGIYHRLKRSQREE